VAKKQRANRLIRVREDQKEKLEDVADEQDGSMADALDRFLR